MTKRNPLVVGLDVGTYKVGVVVAEVGPDSVEIVGIGTAPSTGLQKGTIVSMDATVEAIRRAVEEAEIMAGCDIRRVIVGAGGRHIKGVNSHGVTAVRTREVAREDVERVMEAARAVAIPTDREVLHVLPQEFVVDEQDGIRDPVNMAGVRLEARVHIVTGSVMTQQNLIKCCNTAGLMVEDVLAGPLAAAESVLTAEERELGVALIDIGAGTTGVAVFAQRAVRLTVVLPFGGAHVTNDLTAALRTPFEEAERLKRRHGCALARLVNDDDIIDVVGIGGRDAEPMTPRRMANLIEPRAEEMLALARGEIERAGCEGMLTAGVVLTGGGAVLAGMTELAEQVFRVPVRLGSPLHLSGLVDVVASPMYAHAVGLVLHGLARQHDPARKNTAEQAGPIASIGRVGRRMIGWLQDFF